MKDRDEAWELLKGVVSQYSARELEQINMEHGFCGQTCYTPAEWRQTTMSRVLAKRLLVDWKQAPLTSDIPATPFPKASDKRPLAGIKVIELARVIAGPALASHLAALGAEMIKVQSPNLPDLQPLSVSLNAGKRTCALDLNKKEDKAHLEKLYADADVVIQAY